MKFNTEAFIQEKKKNIESIPVSELIFFALYEDNYDFFPSCKYNNFYSHYLSLLKSIDFSCEKSYLRDWTLRNRNDLYSDNERQLWSEDVLMLNCVI